MHHTNLHRILHHFCEILRITDQIGQPAGQMLQNNLCKAAVQCPARNAHKTVTVMHIISQYWDIIHSNSHTELY